MGKIVGYIIEDIKWLSIVVISLIPAYLLWSFLSPTGFWQLLIFLIVAGVVTAVSVVLVILFVVGTLNW